MNTLIPSVELMRSIENSEIDYMTDRMIAIQNRPGNPEGIEIQRFGEAIGYYSKTMPWGTFNTVKGITDQTLDHLEDILQFYKERNRAIQLEVIPSFAGPELLNRLAELGFYASGSHCSMAMIPQPSQETQSSIRIEEITAEQFEVYATIHCRGTGLPDNGIPYVARNNEVLHGREGWTFFLASLNDTPAAVGVMYRNDRAASLTFAATLPAHRKRGLHRQLLQRRITEAWRRDCPLIVGQCSFLSQSHRNMEHMGMKIGYIRTAWTLRNPG